MDLDAMACPACGCPHWTGLVGWVPGPQGDDIECAVCGLWIWDGQVMSAGRAVSPDVVARESARVADSRHTRGAALRRPLYVPPEDRMLGLALIDVRTMARPSSVTLRFARGADRRRQSEAR
jgi:hypothetical protein